MNWKRLFPPSDNAYPGPKIPFYFLVLIAVVSTVRSLIHIFAPDRGANSIAGITIDVPGGTNIVALFAQWGALQLLLALFYWLVIFQYRMFVPAMLGVAAIEQVFRIFIGHLKPLEVASPPPGAIASEILLPLVIGAFLWSIFGKARTL